jgi:hypothetical protein
MFDASPEGSSDEHENSRRGYLFSYAQIVFNQFVRDARLANDDTTPDTFRQFTIHMERPAERLECHLTAVVFSSLFFEAYIFDYASRRLSASYAEKYLDKLDVVAKWVVVTRLVKAPGLDAGLEVFGRLKGLVALRNRLVHHKTSSGDMYPPPEIPEAFLPWMCVDLIGTMMKLLHTHDDSEEFARFVNRHLGSWLTHVQIDPHLYPIIWNA